MTRSQKEIVTPNGNKVQIYEYLTGGELRQIQGLYMENLSADDFKGDTKSSMSKVPVSTVFKAQEMALKFILISVDGCPTTEAYQAAMDLRETDLDYLMKIVDEYTSGNSKKNSELSPSTSSAE